jgi:UDP-glucose 4-epimerase
MVTGVAGFMGSHLADALIKNGHQVVGIDNLIGGYRSNVPDGVKFIEEDLLNLDSIKPHFEQIDLVLHTACTAYEGLSVFSPALVTNNTFQITSTTLSASVAAGVKKIVYMSSMARYGTQNQVPFSEEMNPNPQDPYGIAKYASELLVKNISETHGLKFSIVVPHNIIGPRQKYDDPFRNVASIMTNRMLSGKQPIIYGDGNQKRCFSFMTDVVEPLIKICETNVADGLVVNIGPDEEFLTINELAENLAKIINFPLDPIYMPDRPQEVKDANCSADLARKILNYKTTTDLDTGLRSLVQWIEESGSKEFSYHLPLEIINESTPRTWKDKLI